MSVRDQSESAGSVRLGVDRLESNVSLCVAPFDEVHHVTPETRRRHDRKGLRYTHDLTDEEWALVAPLIPPAKRGGNKRTVDVREIVNGLMYILGTGPVARYPQGPSAAQHDP